jgi:putative addiction module CopG family antidote
MNAVILPPDLEHFADEAVATGRFRDVGEVVRAGVSLLQRLEQRREQQRAELLASIVTAEEDGVQNGFLTLDTVMRDADALIEEMARSRK